MGIEVKLFECEQIADDKLLFAVIASRYNGKWIFCRHKERDTYEIPGGHREKDENIDDTARRELTEETGALSFDIIPVCIYSVTKDGGEPTYGKLYYAKIHELGALPQFEIAQICLFDVLADKLTYPQIQPHLHHKVQVWLSIQSGKGELWDVYDKDRNKTGRIHERGKPMTEGDYHLVIHAWIQNSDGKFLVMQRAENKGFPFMWESVGGSAITGETSIEAALREIKEEIGLTLDAKTGKCLFTQTRIDDINDVWMFNADFDFCDVKLQQGETIDAKLVSLDEIEQMFSDGIFVPYSYFETFKNMMPQSIGKDNKLKIDRMTAADIGAVYSMGLEIFKDDPWPVEWFNEGVNDPDGYYYLAYIKDELVGFCGMYHITSKTPNYCKIATLAVKQNFRRKGIGNALMLKMLDKAKELGLESAKLEVDTKNSAVKLYEDLGFKVSELKERYYEKSGNDAYIMWRYEDSLNCKSK